MHSINLTTALESLTLLTPKTATGHDPKAIPSAFCPHSQLSFNTSLSRSGRWPFSKTICHQNTVCMSFRPHPSYMATPSNWITAWYSTMVWDYKSLFLGYLTTTSQLQKRDIERSWIICKDFKRDGRGLLQDTWAPIESGEPRKSGTSRIEEAVLLLQHRVNEFKNCNMFLYRSILKNRGSRHGMRLRT
jgi:hypothetical protein